MPLLLPVRHTGLSGSPPRAEPPFGSCPNERLGRAVDAACRADTPCVAGIDDESDRGVARLPPPMRAQLSSEQKNDNHLKKSI